MGSKPPAYLGAPPSTVVLSDESKSILIVDDDPFFRSLLKVMLTQTGLPLSEVLEAEESRSALILCQERPIDLVFCDLNLPKLWSQNGIAIVNEIRKVRPNLPVYIVTADNTAEIIAAVASAGATGHMLKPINLRTLRRILTEAFSSSLSAPGEPGGKRGAVAENAEIPLGS